MHLQKWAYQSSYLEQWRLREAELGREIDAFIAPITPTAAVRHNQFKYYGYASAINLLDWTSVVVPVTFADKARDVKKEGYKALNELDGTVQAECKCDDSFPFSPSRSSPRTPFWALAELLAPVGFTFPL